MELSNLQLIEVKTKDREAPKIQVLVKVENQRVSCGELHRKVCESLGLAAGSRELFSLFSYKLNKKKKVKFNEWLSLPLTDLTIEKWCFDKDLEKKVLQSDNNALHLIFVQAQHDIQSGKLKPSKEESQALEACLDPSFCPEKQYIEICQTLEGYFSFQLESCQLITVITLQPLQMSAGSLINVSVNKSGLAFQSVSGVSLSVPWCKVRSWSICQKELKVTFTCDLLIDHREVPITIETTQAVLLITAVMEFLKTLLKSNPELPPFHSSMVKTTPEGCTFWENSVFGME